MYSSLSSLHPYWPIVRYCRKIRLESPILAFHNLFPCEIPHKQRGGLQYLHVGKVPSWTAAIPRPKRKQTFIHFLDVVTASKPSSSIEIIRIITKNRLCAMNYPRIYRKGDARREVPAAHSRPSWRRRNSWESESDWGVNAIALFYTSTKYRQVAYFFIQRYGREVSIIEFLSEKIETFAISNNIIAESLENGADSVSTGSHLYIAELEQFIYKAF